MFRSRLYFKGNGIVLLIGGTIFIGVGIFLPMFDDTVRLAAFTIRFVVIGILMILGGILFLSLYKREVTNEQKLYEENERLKQKIKALNNNKEQDFRFDEIDDK